MGEKPAGAFDGRGFIVTQAMTSLTGSAGEDFASILRALGYRMEKKAPLPPAAAKTPIVAAPAAALDDASAEDLAIMAGAIALEPDVAVATATKIADIANDTAVVDEASTAPSARFCCPSLRCRRPKPGGSVETQPDRLSGN